MEDIKKRIVELRMAGYTWKQVDQMVFPDKPVHKRGGGVHSWNIALKNKEEMSGAFSKRVIGIFTPTQIHIKLRSSNPFAV